MISKKKAPRTGNSDLDRAIDRIYKDINELVESVNTYNKKSISGNVGDIRVNKKPSGEAEMRVKIDTGWYSTATGTFELTE